MVGPVFCAFPGPAAQAARSLRSALSLGVVHLIPSAVPASVSVRTGQVHLVSVLGSLSLASALLADVSHPESQEVLVRNWEPVCSLVGGAISGAEFAPFPSPLPLTSGRGWASPQPEISSLELLSLSFFPKQCLPLLSAQLPLAGGRCECLGYFSAGSCF